MHDAKFKITGIRLEPADNGLVLHYTKDWEAGTKSGSTWEDKNEVFQYNDKKTNKNEIDAKALAKLTSLHKAKLNNPMSEKTFASY